MSINRRHLLAGLAGIPAIGAASIASAQTKSADIPFSLADLRGTANANELGLRPGTIDDQSRMLQDILDRAHAEDKPVFLRLSCGLWYRFLLP